MTITTYPELVTAVENWINEDSISDRVAEFISLGEAKINRDIRVTAMETTAELNTVADTAEVALPTGFLQAKRMYIDSSPKRLLNFEPSDSFHEFYFSSTTGTPIAYTLEAGNFVLGPTPSGVFTLYLLYWKRLDGLAGGLNDVFTYNPDLYLYAALAEAYKFLNDDRQEGKYITLYEKAKAEVQKADIKNRASGSVLMQRTDTGNP